ncbi:surface antigen-like protein [Litoreibacter meonggei]|uniref:Surface antigen-like protein n=1 Tax=Litoreibacter meonggei TaxID=1049199 RepID=A0A497VAC1_9RHOB|nr:BamA/TamA family outer membrane protein [Litoreibacter meonggei]RLJ36176.1 surface antigen-like protein [Litoreibacter meonggei]
MIRRICTLALLGFAVSPAALSPSYAQQSATTPAPRVFTTIQVDGNKRFRDGDIIATSGLETGTVLGQEDLLAAVEALEYTGEFENVVITSSGNNLIVTVEETPEYSGGLTFGLGFDSDTGLFGAAGLALDNAFGKDLELRGNLVVAEEAQTLRFQARSTNFWSEGVRGGVRLAYENYEYDNTTYDYALAKVEPYVVFDLNQKAALELRYTLASKDISNVAAAASPIIVAEAGRKTSSGIGFSLATSSSLLGGEESVLDSWSVRFDQDFTGLGGDTDLSLSKLSLFARKSLTPGGLAIRTRVEFGAVTGLSGDKPRASERFTLGGASLRGFARGTISPRDVCTGCAVGGGDQVTELGGDYYAAMRTDVLVPIFKDRDSIETFAFFDIGSAWGVDTSTAPAGTLNSDRNFRTSAGIGMSLDTQLGKFEAYLALAENARQYDELQAFGLTFRSEF